MKIVLKPNQKIFFTSDTHYGHKNRISLRGHTHGSFKNIHNERFLDVGVDNSYKTRGNYNPYSLSEVLKEMENKQYRKLSHHNKNTN